MKPFCENILTFLTSLDISAQLPAGVEIMNPYQDENTLALCKKFYDKYYNDTLERKLIVGINPGRFGGGLTGIPFTDPVKLESLCGIANDLKKKVELSADFVYTVIDAFGGPEKFYQQFYISAISPLGFTFDGKNLNYYDLPALQKGIEPFVVNCFEQQLAFNINRNVCYCLGEGKNFAHLANLNRRHKFFREVIPLPHPRFIMQYRRRRIPEFVDLYCRKLNA